jgi:MFS transporter, PPP family, 3-phenylpropionic acid transporter
LVAVAAARRVRRPGRAAAAYAAYFVSVGVWFPYLPVFYQSLGLDLGTIGLFAAAAATTSLLAGPLWGAVADTLDRSGRALPTAALLAAVAGILLWLAGRFAASVPGGPGPAALGLVLVAAVAVAAASGGVGPQLDARAVESVGGDRIGYGRLRAWGSLSFIVTAALVGRLLDVTGPAGMFGVFVPALAVTAAVTVTLPRPGGSADAERSRRPRPVRATPLGPGFGDLLRIPELRAFLLAMFVCWSALNAANAFLSVDLVSLGAPPTVVGIAWAVGAALEVPIMWSYPALAARFGTGPLLLAGPLVIGLRSLGCALAPSAEVLVAITVMQGIGFALSFVGGVAHVARLAPRHLGATAQGLFGGATVGLGAIAGSGIGGLIVGAVGLRGVFTLSALAGVLAAGLIARSLRIGRRAREYDAPMHHPSEAV